MRPDSAPTPAAWRAMPVPMAFPGLMGTAFLTGRPMSLREMGRLFGTNPWSAGKPCGIAPSRRERARSCPGCPRRPLPKPQYRVVMPGDGSPGDIRPQTLLRVGPDLLAWRLARSPRSRSCHALPGLDARIPRTDAVASRGFSSWAWRGCRLPPSLRGRKARPPLSRSPGRPLCGPGSSRDGARFAFLTVMASAGFYPMQSCPAVCPARRGALGARLRHPFTGALRDSHKTHPGPGM